MYQVIYCLIVIVGLSTSVDIHALDKAKHLFILSGQSNMDRMDPAQSFTPTIEKQFGKENVIVVKNAARGACIFRWYRTGNLYQQLLANVKTAIENQPIATITFIWMQGECDSASTYYADVYEARLLGLYTQLQQDLHKPDIRWVIGRISDSDMKNRLYKGWTKIRDTQVKVAGSNPCFSWVNTDDLNDDNGLHYSEAGYRILGKRLAESAIRLIQQDPRCEDY